MPYPNVPERLIPAYIDDPTVHAVFTLGAQRCADERDTLIELVLALVEAKKNAVAAHIEHLQQCPGHWVPSL